MEKNLQPPVQFPEAVRKEFGLDPNLVFLNHGSFGSVPRCVRAAQDTWRDRLEADPIEMIGRRIESMLAEVKGHLAKAFGGLPAEYGLVTNATEGVNAVLRSLRLNPGDELLCTDHVYFAVKQAMRSRAGECGATVREVPVEIPTQSPDALLRPILAAVNAHTKLLVIDHVTSPTALHFPVGQLRSQLPAGTLLLVDGAHAPGSIQLDVSAVHAEFYAANLHKWIMAPKGSAFLRVQADYANQIHPCVISHHFGSSFQREFDWQGTRDFSAWLAVPAALAFLHELGFERVLQHNHALACWAHQLLVHGLDVSPASPLDGCCLTSMATVQLPDTLRRFGTVEALQADLYATERIEVPIIDWGGRWWVRVSAAIYNLPEHYERLLIALKARR